MLLLNITTAKGCSMLSQPNYKDQNLRHSFESRPQFLGGLSLNRDERSHVVVVN